jgi:hypothetical protein
MDNTGDNTGATATFPKAPPNPTLTEQTHCHPIRRNSAGSGTKRRRLIMDREERIRQRAHEIWEREGRPEGREQEHWDQAVQEIESESSEAERGPVAPDPAVGVGSDPAANRPGGVSVSAR